MTTLVKLLVPRFGDPVFAALLVAMENPQVCSVHEYLDMAAPHEPP